MLKITEETNLSNNKLELLYPKFSKIFLVISILCILWIIIVIIGIYSLEMNHNWAVLTLNNWVLFVSILIGIFIILNLFFYYHYFFSIGKIIEFEESEEEFLHGKHIFIYTYPSDSKGGIFSKTYIQIDETSVLRLRNLMIPPDDLWKNFK